MKFSDDSPKIKAPLGLDYIFTFGKCKGQSIEEVIDNEPSYVIWCSENIDWFDLDTDVYDMAEEKSNDEEVPYYNPDSFDTGKWDRY